MRALILHAHPDDELIFAGALMLAHPAWEWTTVSLTGGVRAALYPGTSLGFADEWRILHRSEFLDWRAAVADLALAPDLVVTHNRMGEYGHPHHMAVHAIAHGLFPVVWDFYTEAETTVGPQLARAVTWPVDATPAKRALFDATYPSVYAELAADKPDLIARAFRTEWFTTDRSARL